MNESVKIWLKTLCKCRPHHKATSRLYKTLLPFSIILVATGLSPVNGLRQHQVAEPPRHGAGEGTKGNWSRNLTRNPILRVEVWGGGSTCIGLDNFRHMSYHLFCYTICMTIFTTIVDENDSLNHLLKPRRSTYDLIEQEEEEFSISVAFRVRVA